MQYSIEIFMAGEFTQRPFRGKRLEQAKASKERVLIPRAGDTLSISFQGCSKL